MMWTPRLWWQLIVLPVLAAWLGGCATTPHIRERVVIQRVEIPIYQPCRVALDPKPVFPTETGPIATDIAEQIKILFADRDLRRGWTGELEAALAGCTAADPPH